MSNINCYYDKKIKLDPLNINLNNFSISIGKKVLYDNSLLKISNGIKYGLVGKNGCGKSTLLNCIANRNLPIHQDIDILYVQQEIESCSNTVYETVINSNVIRNKLIEENKILLEQLEQNDSVIDKLNKNEDTLLIYNQDEVIIRKILFGLGFSEADQNKPTSEFSGGWRMRISLARALYLKPKLLLLDEPTNHLDLNTVIWLSWYLNSWENSILIVSHDQGFLNDVCDCIINVENLQLQYYNGNYSKFKLGYNQKLNKEKKDWDKLEKQISTMRKKK